VVNKILSGKERSFNDRFGRLCSHYLFEPVACTPASGKNGITISQKGENVSTLLFPYPVAGACE
jgi:hypothetical protein